MKPILYTRWMLAVLVLHCGASRAAFVAPDWQRGIEGSAYLAWDHFTGTVNTTPDVGSQHIATSTLTEQIGQAFVASSGNLYSFSSPQSYALAVRTDEQGPSPIAPDVQVQLQLSTWTYEIAGRRVTLNGQAGDVTLLSSGTSEHPTFGTYTRYEYLFEWQVNASSLYQFSWDLDQPSTSLAAITLDMYADGAADGLLDYPSLPILPTIPGSDLFDGGQLSPEDLIDGNGDQGLSDMTASPSPVPLPGGAPLLLSALLGLTVQRLRGIAKCNI